MKITTSTALQKRRFQTIKEELSVVTVAADLVAQNHGRWQQKGNEWRGQCPICLNGNHSEAFGADSEKNVWHCFACGEGGDVIQLAKLAGGFDSAAMAVAWLGFTYGVDLPERPEQWFRKQTRQERIRAQLKEVKRNSYRRRLFKYIILPGLEQIEDEQERKQEIEACWRDMKNMPLYTDRWAEDG